MTETNCVFCNIYNEKEPSTILYKDEDVVVFPDIRPASKNHYLIVPKEHLLNAKELKKEHIPVVENLVRHGKRVLEEKGTDLKEARFGFHWPPFNSIQHLHLHAISPTSEMSILSKLIFKENSLWFVSIYIMPRSYWVEPFITKDKKLLLEYTKHCSYFFVYAPVSTASIIKALTIKNEIERISLLQS